MLVKLAGLTLGTLEAYRWHIVRHPGAPEPTTVASIGQVGLHSKTEITQLGGWIKSEFVRVLVTKENYTRVKTSNQCERRPPVLTISWLDIAMHNFVGPGWECSCIWLFRPVEHSRCSINHVIKHLPKKWFREMTSVAVNSVTICSSIGTLPKVSIPLVQLSEITMRTELHINPMNLLMRVSSVASELCY